MNDYDKASRHAARLLDPAGFIRWLMGDLFAAAWRWVDWLDTQSIPFPGEPDRRCDTVAAFDRAAGDAPPLALVVEFMTEPRRLILERLVEYEMRVRHEIPYQRSDPAVLYTVAGVVVNLTGENMMGEWSMAPADGDGLGLWTKARVCNLNALYARAVLTDIESGRTPSCILPWVSLMRGGDAPDTVVEWKRLADTEPDLEKKRKYAALALVFAGKTGCEPVWQKELEGWNVERSPITLEWEAHEKLRTKREDLLMILRERFNQEVPPEIVQAVDAQDDLATLERWLKQAIHIGSLDEMRANVGLLTP